jgi:NAD-dependent DNA ligase
MPPKKASEVKKDADVFADKVFAISGTLSQRKSEITDLIKENGGSVASSVTKKVHKVIFLSLCSFEYLHI